VIASHPRLKFDSQLRAFLTLQDFDSYRVNPSKIERVMTYVEQIPSSVKNMSIASIKEAVATSIVTVKNELASGYYGEEPEEMRPRRENGERVEMGAKQAEVEGNLQIMQVVAN